MDDLAGPANEPDEECLNRARAVFANTLDGVHVYFRHQQRLDDLRQHVINELASSSKHAENQEISSTDRLNYVLGLQKKLYDLQLLEAASKTPLFGIAKTIFSLSKKRTMPKVEEVSKEKPIKGKLNSSTSFKDGIRKPEREPKFPVTPKPSLNVSTSSLNTIPKQQDESSVTGANTTPRMRRIGIRRRHSSFSQKVVENPRASVENDEEKEYGANRVAQRYTKLSILSPNMRSSKPPKEKNDEPPESNSPSTPVSIGPPPEKVTRKRAAAVIAVAANADIITPRATSPRKRANNNNPQAATQLDEAPPDEPTYCTCKQVSFGDMICCDNNKCPIEWFHFGCVNIKVKPTKGKKWFCPDCRHGDKQTVLKPSLMKK